MLHGEKDFDKRGFSCVAGETIKMREINSALRNRGSGTLAYPLERVSWAQGVDEDIMRRGTDSRLENRDNVRNDPTGHNWTDFSEGDIGEMVQGDVDLCQSLRKRKRKQGNDNIHRMDRDVKRTSLTVDAQPNASALQQAEARGDVETIYREKVQVNGASDTPQFLYEDKPVNMNIAEAATVNHLPIGRSSCKGTGHLATLAGFLPSCDKGMHNSFSWLVSDVSKEFTGNRLGNDRCELPTRGGAAADEAFKLYQGLVGRMGDFPYTNCERRGKRDGNVAILEESYASVQLENQKLRAEVASLNGKLNFLLSFAEQGSKKCEYCCFIEEKLKSNVDKPGFKGTGESQPSDLFGKSLSACRQIPVVEGTQCYQYPVWSYTKYKGPIDNEPLILHDDTLKRQNLLTFEKEDITQTKCCLPSKEDSDEGSDPEIQLCVEVLPQMDALETEQIENGIAKLGKSIMEGNYIKSSSGFVEKEHGLERCLNSVEREHCLERDLSSVDREHVPEVCVVTIGMEQNLSGTLSMQDKKLENLQDMAGTQAGTSGTDTHEGNFKQGAGQTARSFLENHDIFDGTDHQGELGDFIDLQCGCTSQRYGDTVGILRVYKSGMLEIYCQCTAECQKGKPMTPAAFEKHGGRGTSRKWKDSIWVVLEDHKVQFSKVKGLDAFYRRYKAYDRLRLAQSSGIKQAYHRDEFLQCKKCLKNRRFRRRNKEECRLFHDASLNPNWECSNFPPGSVILCQDDEEREVRQAIKGCIRSRTCHGCIECVCLGCFTCRFHDCSCRICQEFMQNNN